MWEQIRANRRRSIFLIVGMAIVLSILGYTAGEAIARGAGPLGLLFALVLLAFQLGMYAIAAESILLQGMGAKELSKEDSPRLFNIVEEMVIASGLGYTPKIYLVDAIAPNAFAIGRKPETSAVTLTRAQVVADLQSARSQGLVATTEIGELPLASHAASQVTRAQVRQELSAAQAAGLEASGELDYPPVAG